MQPLMPRNIVPWRSAYHPNQDRPAPDWAASSLYGTPTMRSNVPNFITYQPDAEYDNLRLCWEILLTKHRDSDDSDDSDDDEEEDQEKHRVSAAAQLKGIHWPGMGLFDAATPLQKRQRNQKKDGSILRQLISTSKNLQPIEVVYDGTLNEIKSRDIDTLGEDSDEVCFFFLTFGQLRKSPCHFIVTLSSIFSILFEYFHKYEFFFPASTDLVFIQFALSRQVAVIATTVVSFTNLDMLPDAY